MKKRILSLAMVLALVAVMVMPTAALAGDSATGTFSNNNPPGITTVKLYNTIEAGTEVAAMAPQTVFNARVNVTDLDCTSNLTDLTSLVVKVWYETGGGDATVGEFNAISAGNAQTAIIMTWTQGASPAFVLTEASPSSWDMDPDACVAPANLSGGGIFQFKFTVGNVATQTTGNKWEVAANVTDDSGQSAWKGTLSAAAATMDWYQAITVPGTALDWGLVNPGLDFNESSSNGTSKKAIGTINYLSNGPYLEKVFTGDWATGAIFDVTGGCGTPQYFSLKADYTATWGTAVQVVKTPGVLLRTVAAQTGETGDNELACNLWLKLATTFTKATYSGTITYVITH